MCLRRRLMSSTTISPFSRLPLSTGDIGYRISKVGEGFMPSLKNDPTAEKYQELEN